MTEKERIIVNDCIVNIREIQQEIRSLREYLLQIPFLDIPLLPYNQYESAINDLTYYLKRLEEEKGALGSTITENMQLIPAKELLLNPNVPMRTRAFFYLHTLDISTNHIDTEKAKELITEMKRQVDEAEATDEKI